MNTDTHPQMLKSLIDEDEFCKKLRTSIDEGPRAGFYACFYGLLVEPSVSALEDILSNYATQDIINGIKYLIKFKFDRLSREVSANVLKIVEMMLDYERDLDTLIVNLLRRNMVDEVYSMYQRKEKYFCDHANSLMFLTFFCAQDLQAQRTLDKSSFRSRDFLFMQMKHTWSEFYSSKEQGKRIKRMFRHPWDGDLVFQSPFDIPERWLSVLKMQTPLNILSSKLSAELEMNIAFILECEHNLGFYMHILFNDHIRDENDACWVQRFLVNIPGRVCISKVVNAILRRYPSSFFAVIYDLLFRCGSEQLNGNLVEYIREERNAFIDDLTHLQEEWSLLRDALGRISQGESMDDVAKVIHAMNFSRYYKAIREMERKGVAVVPRRMYDDIVAESFRWDGYAQVYLWKILAFQKIFLGFEVNKPTNGSLEAMEGFEIVRSLSISKERESTTHTRS